MIVSYIAAIMFAKVKQPFLNPRPIQLFRETIQWIETRRYLGVTLHRQLNWALHNDHIRKAAQKWDGCVSPDQ